MDEPRPPRESLAEMLQIERRGDRFATARLEGFWGEATPGDLLARAVLAAGRTPTAVQASFVGEARPETELALSCETLSPECARVSVRDGGALLAEVSLRFD